MNIYFKSKKLQKICNSERSSTKEWGPEISKKVRQRLFELYAAEKLSDISFLPPPRLHELDGRRTGQFAVDLKQPYRLIFEPANDLVPIKKMAVLI